MVQEAFVPIPKNRGSGTTKNERAAWAVGSEPCLPMAVRRAAPGAEGATLPEAAPEIAFPGASGTRGALRSSLQMAEQTRPGRGENPRSCRTVGTVFRARNLAAPGGW